jgi:hypothetical protein
MSKKRMGKDEFYEKLYTDWMHLLNRLVVGRNYGYSDNNGKTYKIPKGVYKSIEEICYKRLNEAKLIREAECDGTGYDSSNDDGAENRCSKCCGSGKIVPNGKDERWGLKYNDVLGGIFLKTTDPAFRGWKKSVCLYPKLYKVVKVRITEVKK